MNLCLRVITAGILLVIAVALIFFAESWLFSFFVLLLTCINGFEWAMISGLKKKSATVFVAVCAGIWTAIFLVDTTGVSVFPALAIASFLWLLAIVIVVTYSPEKYNGLLSQRWLKLVFGALVLTGFWLSLRYLHGLDLVLLLVIATTCVAFDSFAYFFGRWKGKSKLSPAISPGKTWEGLWGGVCVALLIAALVTTLCLQLLSDVSGSFVYYMLFSVLTLPFALFGDLFESLIKRIGGVKDSGQLLPGHGGFLDRFDSYLAALPVMAFVSIVGSSVL